MIQVYCNDVFAEVENYDEAATVIDRVIRDAGYDGHIVLLLRYPDVCKSHFWSGDGGTAEACFEDGEALRSYPCWQEVSDSYWKPLIDRLKQFIN